MKVKLKKKNGKNIVSINIDKKGPLDEKDVKEAIKVFKEYYENHNSKGIGVVNG